MQEPPSLRSETSPSEPRDDATVEGRSSTDEIIDIKRAANDRVLRCLGVRELHLNNLPEGAKIVDMPNQVGGHKTMKSVEALLLLEWEGRRTGKKTSCRYVLKILHDGGRGLVELGFYEKLASHKEGAGAQGEDPLRTELEGFLCPYFGAVRVITEASVTDDGEEIPATTHFYLVIMDMNSGFDRPCTMDIKMGRVTVEPGEREEKRIGQLRKYPNQPIVGFRYVGMKWSSFAEEGEEFFEVVKKKVWGAKMPVEGNGLGLTTFLHDGTSLRRGRVKCALRKIRALQDWFARQDIFRFYASSVLITYDSADPPEGEDGEEEVEMRMIDFAHAVPVDGKEEDGEGAAEAPADEGYLHGLSNLVGILEELLEVTAGPDAPRDLDTIADRLEFMTKVAAAEMAGASGGT